MSEGNDRNKAIDDLLRIAVGSTPPPLYTSIEIDGVIVKQYEFIRGHSKLSNLPELDPGNIYSDKEYSLLTLHKTELEKQIELNRGFCIGKYNHIKLSTELWLSDKFNKLGIPLQNEYTEQLTMFMFQINTMLNWIMLGVELDIIKRDLKVTFKQIEVVGNINAFNDNPVTFDILELIDNNQDQIESIERLVFRTVDLYKDYLTAHSKLYNIELDTVIKKIVESGNTIDIVRGKSEYGQHQPNREWIVRTWNEIRPGKKSVNAAVLKVKELYNQEFKTVIGETTIRDYVGIHPR